MYKLYIAVLYRGIRVALKIRELRDGMRRVDVEGEISEISEPRIVNLRAGGQARVADAMLQDDTGSIKLSLWDEQIDKVSVGSRVRIENGYINSFRGEVRLNVGKYGKLHVLS
ncbi:MAG: OB-fold nucleic acid binding domain-containing protein [Nitrososphaerales archaeon]